MILVNIKDVKDIVAKQEPRIQALENARLVTKTRMSVLVGCGGIAGTILANIVGPVAEWLFSLLHHTTP